MEKMEFKLFTSASPEKLWSALWDDKNYREWTSAFAAGSRAESDWQEGSKVLFLDANNDGLISVIAKKVPNKHMSFRHLGAVKKGVESIGAPEDKEWAGAHENYTLTAQKDGTGLTVELESKGMPENMIDYFKSVWPKALQQLKEIAERT